MRTLATITVLLLIAVPSFTQDQAATPPQKVAEVHGIKINYYDLGEKSAPTVLLLHGLGGKGEHHPGTAQVLAKAFRVIIPDQIGPGTSDKPAPTYRKPSFSDFNNELLD